MGEGKGGQEALDQIDHPAQTRCPDREAHRHGSVRSCLHLLRPAIPSVNVRTTQPSKMPPTTFSVSLMRTRANGVMSTSWPER